MSNSWIPADQLRMAVWLQVRVRGCGLGLRPRLYACSVCDTVAAAVAACGLWRYIRVITLLRSLHWLLVPQRISFKLSVMVYQFVRVLGPAYLADSL